MTVRKITTVALWLIFGQVVAQDPVLYRSWYSGQHINPAIIGIEPCTRIYLMVNDRGPRLTDFWTGTANAYATILLGIDGFSEKLNGSIGIQYLGDFTAGGLLSFHQIAITYAYRKQVTRSNFWQLGISFLGRYYLIDYTRMVFPEDIDPVFGLTGFNSARYDRYATLYPSASIGFLYFSPKLVGGIALHHITRLRGYQEPQYQARVSMHLSTAFQISRASYLVPQAIFDATGKTYRLQAILRWRHVKWSLYAGAYSGFKFLDGVLLGFSHEVKGLRLAYTLGLDLNGPIYSGQSHELGIETFFCPTDKRVSISECPAWR
ncbi:MAG: type IX secretion system membrane protein PorP/SprF [Chlorobi bacterium]|nr:type IX secretion system membrane protein PorP/SprF [Chlorobiota bacterium]